MPKPATLLDLVAVIRASRLVAESRLQAALAGHDGRPPAALLDGLVTDGTCTAFQAAHLAAGRWRGFVLGPYRLLDRLGGGGMGQVFLAEHTTTGRAVAVKLLAANLADDPTARVRFAREARAAAALAHPNIARVFDLDAEASPPFLVMEYIDGLSLQAAVARHGAFPAGWAARVGHQVALALQCAADADLVHRDVKPANVLLDRAGDCKLLDLGIVLVGGAAGLTLVAGERTILGTADYLAPEQAVDSSAVDCRADLYALGGTLYFLLAGHPPFPDGAAITKLMAKQFREPPPLDRLRPGLPAGLAGVVQKLLARRPADRYATPAKAAAALAPYATADRVGPDFLVTLFAGRRPAPGVAGPPRPRDGRESETSGTVDASAGSNTDVIPIPAACLPRLPAAEPAPPAVGDFDFEAESPTAVVPRSEIARAFPGPAWARRGRRFWLCAGAALTLTVVLAALAVAAAAARPGPQGGPPPPPPPRLGWLSVARLFAPRPPGGPDSPAPQCAAESRRESRR